MQNRTNRFFRFISFPVGALLVGAQGKHKACPYPLNPTLWIVFFIFIHGIGLIGFSPVVRAEVWKAKRNWDEIWEQRYSEWIEESVTPTLFQPSGLKFDCADLAYGLRAIFAREHQLPFIASSEEGERYGHFSREWDAFPTDGSWERDERFCTFLSDLFRDVVSTRSFRHDTYVIALTPETLRPGIIVYEDKIAAHAVIIGKIGKDTLLPITWFESFVPGYSVISTTQKIEIQLYSPTIPNGHSGVVRWKWPVLRNKRWDYVPDEEMPGYSTEQHQADFSYRSRIGAYLNRLAYRHLYGKPLDEDNLVKRLSKKLLDTMIDRAIRVREAESEIEKRGLHHLPKSFDRRYGTKPLDKELCDLIQETWPLLSGYGIPHDKLRNELQGYALIVSENHIPILVTRLMELFTPGHYSEDPRQSALERWGVKN